MVGIFAGRGDVILAMAMCLGLGIVSGWWIRGKRDQFVAWAKRKATRGNPASR